MVLKKYRSYFIFDLSYYKKVNVYYLIKFSLFNFYLRFGIKKKCKSIFFGFHKYKTSNFFVININFNIKIMTQNHKR